MKDIYQHLIHYISGIYKMPWMRVIALAIFLISPFKSQAEEEHVFLITGFSSSITTVSKHDLRRIYLGGTAIDTPEIASPVINKADEATYRLFLKNIMHMTEHGYKRKVIKRIFRQGSDKILEISSLSELDNHFKHNPNDICFISAEHKKQMLNIKVIKELW